MVVGTHEARGWKPETPEEFATLKRDGGAGDAVSLGKVGHPRRAAFTDDDADDVSP